MLPPEHKVAETVENDAVVVFFKRLKTVRPVAEHDARARVDRSAADLFLIGILVIARLVAPVGAHDNDLRARVPERTDAAATDSALGVCQL